MRVLRRVGHEQVLHHDKVEFAERIFDAGQERGGHRVIAGEPESFYFASPRSVRIDRAERPGAEGILVPQTRSTAVREPALETRA